MRFSRLFMFIGGRLVLFIENVRSGLWAPVTKRHLSNACRLQVQSAKARALNSQIDVVDARAIHVNQNRLKSRLRGGLVPASRGPTVLGGSRLKCRRTCSMVGCSSTCRSASAAVMPCVGGVFRTPAQSRPLLGAVRQFPLQKSQSVIREFPLKLNCGGGLQRVWAFYIFTKLFDIKNLVPSIDPCTGIRKQSEILVRCGCHCRQRGCYQCV